MTDSSKIFDGLLVLQYRSGTKKAFSALVDKYHNRLCKHSYWYTHDLDASKDIVQDCWSTMIKKLDSLKNPNLFGSWAFRIVTRKSLDFVSKRNRELTKLKEYRLNFTTPDNDETNTIAVQKLLKGIHALPKEQQIVLRLFYMEGYSLSEMNEILEITVGTIKSRLFHAREKLKVILKE